MNSYRAYDKTDFNRYLEVNIANEGLSDSIAFLKDMVNHIFRTFKLNLTHITKEYIQSEFQHYYYKHKSRLELFFSSPTKKLVPSTMLPMPDGMVAKYTTVVPTLLEMILLPFDRLLKQIISTTHTLTDLLEHFTDPALLKVKLKSTIQEGKLDLAITTSEMIQNTLPSYFVKGRVTASTVGEQFNNKEEVLSIINGLLTASDSYKTFIHDKPEVIRIEDHFRKLSDIAVAKCRSLNGVDKLEIKDILYVYIKSIADLLDYYSVALNELLRIEHKFILCLDQILDNA